MTLAAAIHRRLRVRGVHLVFVLEAAVDPAAARGLQLDGVGGEHVRGGGHDDGQASAQNEAQQEVHGSLASSRASRSTKSSSSPRGWKRNARCRYSWTTVIRSSPVAMPRTWMRLFSASGTAGRARAGTPPPDAAAA